MMRRFKEEQEIAPREGVRARGQVSVTPRRWPVPLSIYCVSFLTPHTPYRQVSLRAVVLTCLAASCLIVIALHLPGSSLAFPWALGGRAKVAGPPADFYTTDPRDLRTCAAPPLAPPAAAESTTEGSVTLVTYADVGSRAKLGLSNLFRSAALAGFAEPVLH